MNSAFVIGNGESRLIFPLELLKNQGCIYGCNAIYRTHSDLCDRIVAVSPEMQQELTQAKQQDRLSKHTEIIGADKISSWNYVLEQDTYTTYPKNVPNYRYWSGGKPSKNKKSFEKVNHRDFSEARGSGCSAVLHAAECGYTDIFIIGFDLLGAEQWQYGDRELSRKQNNVYKDSNNYPTRDSMKGYLKYEWLYQLTQTFRRFPKTNFYFVNRLEYITFNPLLADYFSFAPNNIVAGIYADLKKIIDKQGTPKWMYFKKNRLLRRKF